MCNSWSNSEVWRSCLALVKTFQLIITGSATFLETATGCKKNHFFVSSGFFAQKVSGDGNGQTYLWLIMIILLFSLTHCIFCVFIEIDRIIFLPMPPTKQGKGAWHFSSHLCNFWDRLYYWIIFKVTFWKKVTAR